ncbi:zinc ribbon domain-containing protein [Thermophilibacter sp.]
MFCPNCGAQVPDGSKFCTSCGSTLGAAAPAPAPAPAPTPAPAPAPSDQQLAVVEEKPRGGRGKTVAIVVLAVLLLAAVAFIVWQFVIPQVTGSQSAAQQPAQTQPADPDATADPDDTADDPNADTLVPSSDVTLESYLRDAGQYDTMCDTMVETLSSTAGDALLDADASIEGNTLVLSMTMNVPSSDGTVAQRMLDTFLDEGIVDQMASVCEQLETAADLSGITWYLDFYASDGTSIGYVEYGTEGVVDYSQQAATLRM